MLTLQFVAATVVALGLTASSVRFRPGETDVREAAAHVPTLAARCAAFDADGDGVLTHAEVRALVAALR